MTLIKLYIYIYTYMYIYIYIYIEQPKAVHRRASLWGPELPIARSSYPFQYLPTATSSYPLQYLPKARSSDPFSVSAHCQIQHESKQVCPATGTFLYLSCDTLMLRSPSERACEVFIFCVFVNIIAFLYFFLVFVSFFQFGGGGYPSK